MLVLTYTLTDIILSRECILRRVVNKGLMSFILFYKLDCFLVILNISSICLACTWVAILRKNRIHQHFYPIVKSLKKKHLFGRKKYLNSENHRNIIHIRQLLITLELEIPCTRVQLLLICFHRQLSCQKHFFVKA